MATKPRPRCQHWVLSILLLLVGCCYQTTSAANILFFLPFGSTSHVHSIVPLMENLGLRGHNVTFLTMIPSKSPIKSVKVFYMKELEDLYESVRPNSIEMMEMDITKMWNFMSIIIEDLCTSMMTNEQFRLIVQDKATRYDLVIMDNLISECGLSIIPLLGNPPLIYFCTTTIYDYTALALDIPVPFAYVPSLFMPQFQRMNFWQRLQNTLINLGHMAMRKFYIFPTVNKIVQQHWPGIPRLQDVEQNVTMVLTNSHSPSLDFIRPTAPFMVEVGGTHCKPSKKLGKDLEDFFGQSGSDGFIYFSMGTNIRSNDMTPKKIRMFLDAFGRLKQTVLWKFESNLTDLPANVRITKWAPQQDIIGHPNIKLFITHGGQLSTQEAVYHAVPILGLPIGWDQVINLDSGIAKGFARKLHYANLSSDDIYEQITEIISNKSYKEKAAYYSSLLRDRPKDPLETATYWVEYVIRHKEKAIQYLRFNAAKKLNFFQYFLLDVIAFNLAILALIAVILFYIGKFIVSKLCKKKQHYQKNKNA